MKNDTIVFDLDDTLVPEIEFLKSAFWDISNFLNPGSIFLYEQMMQWFYNKENVFANLIQTYSTVTINELIKRYRNHYPAFNSSCKNKEFLLSLQIKDYYLGLISDGYSVTQRNKIKALGIEGLFDLIIISEEFGSEKPNEKNYSVFHKFQSEHFYYIGDNLTKDFITPNKLGWITICLKDNGQNIHPQCFDMDPVYLPNIIINNLLELNQILGH
ncbi:MAG: HAD family hydrolase [bacterium]